MPNNSTFLFISLHFSLSLQLKGGGCNAFDTTTWYRSYYTIASLTPKKRSSPNHTTLTDWLTRTLAEMLTNSRRFFRICDKCRELASYEAKFCSCIPAAYLPTKSREKEERGRESPLSTLYSSPYLLFLLIGNGERNSSFLSIFYSSSYLLFVLAFSLVRSVSISCHFLFLSPFPLNLNLNLNLNL